MLYFFFVDTLLAVLWAVEVLGGGAFPAREKSWLQNAPISSGLPSRKESSLSWREDADLAEPASASTKSTEIGSDAPVKRIRESETKVLLSMLDTQDGSSTDDGPVDRDNSRWISSVTAHRARELWMGEKGGW